MMKESTKGMLSILKDNVSKKASVHTFKGSLLMDKIKQALFLARRKFKSMLRFQDSTRMIEPACPQVKTAGHYSPFTEPMAAPFTDEAQKKYERLENGYQPGPADTKTYRLLSGKELMLLLTNRSGTMQRLEN